MSSCKPSRNWIVAALMMFGLCVGAEAQQQRPAITGISHMCVYAHDMAASQEFYAHGLGAAKASDPYDAQGVRYYFSPTQFVEVLPLPADAGISRMACVAFATRSAKALHAYLAAAHVSGLSDVQHASDGSEWFRAADPEGNRVEFVQAPAMPHVAALAGAKPISTHMIHVGFLVRSRSDEDAFYRKLLGFRPYWYGAMHEDKLDWISHQVPDGHDWLEYMMVGDGSDTPSDHVDARTLGVLNHFSLGVVNMEAAVTKLIAGDRLSPRHDGPQMGRDGKWQANLYDPDGTRVELMEFQPVVKPCCSAFTASSPTH